MWTDKLDDIFVVNLKNRPDRLELINEEMIKHNMFYKRREAVESDDGILGLIESVKSILEYSIQMEYDCIALIEDDCKIIFDDLEVLMSEIWKQLPPDFDILYMGTNLCQTNVEKYSENLIQLTNGYATHFLIYSKAGIVKTLKAINQMYRTIPLDVLIRDQVLQDKKSFCTFPLIATQRDGKSDIEKRDVCYKPFLEDRFNQRTKHLW